MFTFLRWALLFFSLTTINGTSNLKSSTPSQEKSLLNLESNIEMDVDRPSAADYSQLCPVNLLARSLQNYREQVFKVRYQLIKQEWIQGELKPEERLDVLVREQPYSIRMKWISGAPRVAGTTIMGALYNSGQNQGKVTVYRPDARLAFLKFYDIDPLDAAARASSRYSITEAGPRHMLERTYQAWAKAKEQNQLDVEYLGLLCDDETNQKPCHVFRRTCRNLESDPFSKSDPITRIPSEGIKTITIYLEEQAGYIAKVELLHQDGSLLGRYLVQFWQTNPSISSNDFTKAGLE